MKFAYTRRGGPLVQWDGRTAPSQSRAGETRSLGAFDYDIPRPGAPEVVSGYESPEPGASIIHLGGGYIPEGAVRGYGQQFLAADAPATPDAAPFDLGLIRKAAVLASAYHGAKRNHGSVWWGLLWALGAYVAPLYGVSAVGIALAQGFGQEKPRSNPSRNPKKAKRRGMAKIRHDINVRRKRQGYFKTKNVRNRRKRNEERNRRWRIWRRNRRDPHGNRR